MRERNISGSGKATSCIRAMDLLGSWLSKPQSKFRDCSDIWSVSSIERISALHEYVLEQQKQTESGLFSGEEPISYWRDGWCSAGLKNYKEFLILNYQEQYLWDLVEQTNITPSELLRRLNEERINSIDGWVPEQNIDFTTKEGKEKLREVKMRVNQGFFRRLVLSTYQAQCCVTGLNIPEVLRASHIVAWSADTKNRLNPTNGLCLSATYDAAFDRHLISFDESYRMILSPALKDYYNNEAFNTHFLAFEGRQISLPNRFCPDQEFLEKHRDQM